MWISLSIFSNVFLSSWFLEFTILLSRHDRMSEIMFNWSSWWWMSRWNWEQYCEILTKHKFSLFMKELISIICFIIWMITEWSIQIMISVKNSFIVQWIFLIIQTRQAIFSSVDQYQISASIRSLLRKRINSIFCWFFLTVWSSELSWLFYMW